jgi:3-deoxy-D-manno-octulosonic-acid transferase
VLKKLWIIYFFVTYQIIQIIGIPFLLTYLLLRKIKGKPVFGNALHRLGFVPKADKKKNIYWFHAASVGEVLSIQFLVEKIKRENKNSFVYVTVGTLAGYDIAQKQVQPDCVAFLPFDFLFCMMVAFLRICPKKIFIVEAELWPNFLLLASLKKIPLILLNARVKTNMSRFSFFLRRIFQGPLYQMFSQIYTQTERDEVLLKKWGVDEKRVETLGNVKIVNVIQKKQRFKSGVFASKTKDNDQKVLLCGSIHPGELDIYLELFNVLQKNHKIKLVLAPRHFHWLDQLMMKVRESSNNVFLLDEEVQVHFVDETKKILFLQKLIEKHEIVVIGTIGCLFSLYQFADIFFLGGTFVPVGGHNLFEPAVWGCPMIIGPYHHTVKYEADALQQGGALIKVRDGEELLRRVEDVLRDDSRLKIMSGNAEEWIKNSSGVVEEKIREF